jgi:hypothetical protein
VRWKSEELDATQGKGLRPYLPQLEPRGSFGQSERLTSGPVAFKASWPELHAQSNPLTRHWPALELRLDAVESLGPFFGISGNADYDYALPRRGYERHDRQSMPPTRPYVAHAKLRHAFWTTYETLAYTCVDVSFGGYCASWRRRFIKRLILFWLCFFGLDIVF